MIDENEAPDGYIAITPTDGCAGCAFDVPSGMFNYSDNMELSFVYCLNLTALCYKDDRCDNSTVIFVKRGENG